MAFTTIAALILGALAAAYAAGGSIGTAYSKNKNNANVGSAAEWLRNAASSATNNSGASSASGAVPTKDNMPSVGEVLDTAKIVGITNMAAQVGNSFGVPNTYDYSQLGDMFGKGYSANELETLLEEEYGGTPFEFWNPSTWFADHNFDWDALNQDYDAYLEWRDKVGEMPDEIDYDAVANLANAQIDAENAQVGALYDQMLSRSEDSYRNALAENNAMYNDQVNTLLSNSAAETNALAGSMAWQQKRATRNAITRGASAAQRLTASINAQLGTQAQASTQALETSNTLAQMLLSQRQAASSIRQNYNSDLNSYASNKASLLSGTAERKASYRNSQLSAAESMHDAQMDQWNDRLSAYGGSGLFANAYRKQQQRSQGKSTYTY